MFKYNLQIYVKYWFFLRYKFTLMLEFPYEHEPYKFTHTLDVDAKTGRKLAETFSYLEAWSAK